MGKSKMQLKLEIIDAVIHQKEVTLEDFRSNQRSKLDQTSKSDIDNKQYESKTEETLHELELLNHNVEILEKEILSLRNIPRDLNMDKVQFGSLVEIDNLNILVAVAQENMDVEGIKVVGISTAAPIYSKMQGLSEGAHFELNDVKQTIKAIN